MTWTDNYKCEVLVVDWQNGQNMGILKGLGMENIMKLSRSPIIAGFLNAKPTIWKFIEKCDPGKISKQGRSIFNTRCCEVWLSIRVPYGIKKIQLIIWTSMVASRSRRNLGVVRLRVYFWSIGQKHFYQGHCVILNFIWNWKQWLWWYPQYLQSWGPNFTLEGGANSSIGSMKKFSY